jgi:hypothetical protein
MEERFNWDVGVPWRDEHRKEWLRRYGVPLTNAESDAYLRSFKATMEQEYSRPRWVMEDEPPEGGECVPLDGA